MLRLVWPLGLCSTGWRHPHKALPQLTLSEKGTTDDNGRAAHCNAQYNFAKGIASRLREAGLGHAHSYSTPSLQLAR